MAPPEAAQSSSASAKRKGARLGILVTALMLIGIGVWATLYFIVAHKSFGPTARLSGSGGQMASASKSEPSGPTNLDTAVPLAGFTQPETRRWRALPRCAQVFDGV